MKIVEVRRFLNLCFGYTVKLWTLPILGGKLIDCLTGNRLAIDRNHGDSLVIKKIIIYTHKIKPKNPFSGIIAQITPNIIATNCLSQ